MENNELTHHGIKGMRWGVRRYQNPDGTLTAKGKKRYAAEMEKLKEEERVLKNKQRTKAKVDRLLKKRQELDDMKNKMSGKSKEASTSDKPKTIADMTDEELIAKINRLRLEQTYKSLTPETKTKGEVFVDTVLKPAGAKLGKKILDETTSAIRKKLGIDTEDAMSKLKKEAEKAEYEMKIRKNERDKNRDKPKDADAAPEDSEGKSKTYTFHKKKNDKSDATDNSSEPLTGKVFGKGTSSRKSKSSNDKTKSSDYYDPIYTDFVNLSNESPSSTAVSAYRSNGKSAVSALLSGPAGQYHPSDLKDD